MRPLPSIKVLVLHSDPLVARGLKASLREQPDFELLADPGRHAGASSLPPPRPDVIVADYERGLACAWPPRAGQAAPGVLIVTPRCSAREIRQALEQGVQGYLILGCAVDELVDAVRALHRGTRHVGVPAARLLAEGIGGAELTTRETEVLRALVEGHGNKAIARKLDIALGTVKTHLQSIFKKFDATSRTEVAVAAEKRGLLAPPASEPGAAWTRRRVALPLSSTPPQELQ